MSRASGQGSGTIDLSFQSNTIPSSVATLLPIRVNFGDGPDSRSVNLRFNTDDLSTGEHTFTVKGTKRNAASDSATNSSTTLEVTSPPNPAPTANAGSDFSVKEGTDAVMLQGSGSDSDGTITLYQWEKVVSGTEPTVTLRAANTPTTIFDAPDVTADTDLTFKLTVTDNDD